MNYTKLLIATTLILTTIFISACTQKQEAYVPTQTIIKALR